MKFDSTHNGNRQSLYTSDPSLRRLAHGAIEPMAQDMRPPWPLAIFVALVLIACVVL